MGGGKKNQLQQQSTSTAQTAVTNETDKANQLNTNLTNEAGQLNTAITGALPATQNAATTLATTGDINPSAAGGDTYNAFAQTGGYTPDQEQAFIRQGTDATQAVYSNLNDQMQRDKALSGGYSPGFDASTAAASRVAAESVGETGLGAQTALHTAENTNKLAGAGGQLNVAGAQQQGQEAGATALQNFSSMGLQALNQDDITQLQNNLATGQLTMSQAQLLNQMQSQMPSAYQNIISGVNAASGLISAYKK